MGDRIPRLHWHRSSFSGGLNNECVEVAYHLRKVWVRDSNSPRRTILQFSRPAWTEFLAELPPSP
ncbi:MULTISPECIES: DUF397 domain-containing protein [Streptomyces]|uniref:DUF397 domain-containing protein n=2 Tax=Streptomyces TaxID=1883 RepID=A0A3Q9FVB4_STRLT|nr:DUF397 domain-containing protein [Streptomyces luteoverticillatus]AZQ71827.1 DUF397 domain-containing protein [Streptomyces luteoverticillatus]